MCIPRKSLFGSWLFLVFDDLNSLGESILSPFCPSFPYLTKSLNSHPSTSFSLPEPRIEQFPAECGNGQDPADHRCFAEATDGVSSSGSFLSDVIKKEVFSALSCCLFHT